MFFQTKLGNTQIGIIEHENHYYVTEMQEDFHVYLVMSGTRKECIDYVIERLHRYYREVLTDFVVNIIEHEDERRN